VMPETILDSIGKLMIKMKVWEKWHPCCNRQYANYFW
jgi:hypothetical protein